MPMPMPAAGTPYHRLTARLPWWRTLLTLIGALIGAQIAMIPAALASRHVSPDGVPILGDFTELVLSFVAVACILPVTILIIRWGEGRRAATLVGVTGRPAWPWLAVCSGLAATCIVIAFAISIIAMTVAALAGASPPSEERTLTLEGAADRLIILPILLFLIIGQVAAEEVLTRGVVLQAVGRLTRSPWPAIIVQAVVFTALHGAGELWGTLGVLTMGVALGWITVRTGGLEAAFSFHFLFNCTVAVPTVIFGATSPTDNAVTGSWPQALILGGAATIYTLIASVLARPLGINAAVTDPQPQVTAPADLIRHGTQRADETARSTR